MPLDRRLASEDCTADTAAILAHLSADRCYTVGASGGGPHALACAALLADRVLACATVAGVGPFGAQDLDFLEGMGRENHEEFGAALAGPAQLQAYLEREAPAFASVTKRSHTSHSESGNEVVSGCLTTLTRALASRRRASSRRWRSSTSRVFRVLPERS